MDLKGQHLFVTVVAHQEWLKNTQHESKKSKCFGVLT